MSWSNARSSIFEARLRMEHGTVQYQDEDMDVARDRGLTEIVQVRR